MLRLNSNNQIVSLYFYDNKKQTTFVNSSCHFKTKHEPFAFNFDLYELLSFIILRNYVLQVSSICRWTFRQVRPNIYVKFDWTNDF